MTQSARRCASLARAVMDTLEQRQMLSTVAGAYLFYNNSAFDGNNAGINAADDGAIASDKQPLRELQRAGFANYSSYSRGLNGLMIDIDRPNGTPTLDDFTFRMGNDLNDPFQWSAAPSPTSFTIRPGAGQNGATRFVFTWDDASAVKGKWLQVTALPTARTGLYARDTFYFGSAIGETGNAVGSFRVDGADQLAIRAHPRNLLNPAAVDDRYDINRDRKVDGADQLIARAYPTNYISELRLITAPLAPAGDLKVDVYSPSEARLTWNDRSQTESYYSIQMQQGDGTFREVQQAVVNSTAALLTGLPAGSSRDFRVVPVASSAPATVPQTTAATLRITTPERLTAASLGQWWAVTVSGSLVRGEAGYTGTGSASVPSYKLLVMAESAEAAVGLAVQGSATITNTFVTPNQTKTYTFPNQSAFKVGSISSLSSISGFDANIVKANLGATDSTMVIMLEDQIEWQPADNDFDDFGFKVSVTPFTSDPLAIKATDIKPTGSKCNTGGDPVRYSDGALELNSSDLPTGVAGWGQTRSFTNQVDYHTVAPVAGNNWIVTQRPYLRQLDSGSVMAVDDDLQARWFSPAGGGAYTAVFDVRDKLALVGQEFVLTGSNGSQTRYYDFAGTTSASLRGQFKSLTDAKGNTTVATYAADGSLSQVMVSDRNAVQLERYAYTYTTSGAIQNVTLSRFRQSAWRTVRQVDYAYYGSADNFGNAGDLKTATIKDSVGTVIETKYYRYYKPYEANGYVGGVKYVFDGRDFARLSAAFANPLTASDAQVAPYARLYLQYDAVQRVTLETVAAMGASAGSNGRGTLTYSYSVNPAITTPNPADTNTWYYKTIETLPDGNQNIVYSNAGGEMMLKVFNDISDPANPTLQGKQWGTFRKYDAAGRTIWEAQPSAVALPASLTTLEQYPDLMHSVSGNYQYLNDNAGVINITDYYATTTATGTTAGAVAGYQQYQKVQHGELATPILISAADYFANTAGGTTTYPQAHEIVYANDNGTGTRTTSYTYTWYTDSQQVQSITTTLPVVSAAQNGPGTASTSITWFDSAGRPFWTKDAAGFLQYAAYDPATGALVKVIEDVDTTQSSQFTGLPGGWVTPAGGGLNLITNIAVDDLGRTTKETDPAGRITHTVYKDAAHEIRIYAGWNSTTHLATGPTALAREDRALNYDEVLTMSATPHLDASGNPDGAEAVGNVQSLSRDFGNLSGQTTSQTHYFNLTGLTYSTAAGLGVDGVNYYTTTLSYDANGDVYRATSPTGTISETRHDSLGRVASIWVGTTVANLTKISESRYDGNSVGDGNLTQATLFPGGSEADRVTQYLYDWRDRRISAKSGAEASEGTTTNRPLSVYTYDNLGELTASATYDGDGIAMTDANADGLPDSLSSSARRSYQTRSYDDLGRVYRTQQFSVDQTTGAVSASSLTADTFYDRRGNVIKATSPGGLVQKFVYDGAGRATKAYATDGGGDTSWADAGNVTGDTVLQQTENTYDGSGNAILTTTRQRFHDTTGTGELGTPASTTQPKARVSYDAYYYDLADRLTDSVGIGTNGGNAWTRPASAPTRSDTALVTSYAYNAAGLVDTVTDPKGIAGKTFYDALGRTTKTIDAYTDGVPTNSTNQTTQYTYDGNDNVLTMKAVLPGGTFQETKYVYGASTVAGDGVNSNDLLVATRYPDKTTGLASTGEQETYHVNALGQTLSKTDRNGNVHTYALDVLGRVTSATVTTLGSGVDGAVRRLGYTYNALGLPEYLTSYSDTAGTTIVNQVKREYNGLGQLTAEYQAHSGAVNTSTTPKVQYAYSDLAHGSRQATMTYPNGRVLTYNYGSGSDVSSLIGRLTSISDSSGTLEAYTFLGLSTVVDRSHPQPGVDLSYIKLPAESIGDAGDQYTGLDRFGRIVDQRWITTSGSDADRNQYGYDRNSNVLYEQNVVNSAMSELYGPYDSLNRLTTFDRGTLNTAKDGLVGQASRSQDWSLDALGNSTSVTTDGTVQNRSANAQNELTQMGSATLTYDANGNTTVDQTGKTFVYDAWNRLVEVKNGQTSLIRYSMDAMGRRVVDGTTDVYYSAEGQKIEDRVGGQTRAQYVWSPVYVNAMIERDRDTNADGTLDERVYVTQDANFNVTAIVSTAGTVLERFIYDAYGKRTVLSASWQAATEGYGFLQGFQGGFADAVTGKIHFGARDYDPETMRWMEQDPNPAGQYADGMSLYQFVRGNPAGLVDPTGLAAATAPTSRPTTQPASRPTTQPRNPITQDVLDFIKANEGVKSKVYLDTKGIPTVGVGHNMRTGAKSFEDVTGNSAAEALQGRVALTPDQINSLLAHDLEATLKRARREIASFDELPCDAQKVILDLEFNMGSLAEFKQFRESVRKRDWNQAAWDLGHKSRAPNSAPSPYATDTKGRATRNMDILRNIATRPTTRP